jgi:hypothetical protein
MYYLFCGYDYEAHGGAKDCNGVFDTVLAAQEAASNTKKEWAHIADANMNIVCEWNTDKYERDVGWYEVEV